MLLIPRLFIDLCSWGKRFGVIRTEKTETCGGTYIYASNDMKFHLCAVRWANIDKISIDSGIVGGE